MKNIKYICPVLQYSNITNDKNKAKGATVHLDKFKSDILTLLEKGYSPISLLEIVEANNLHNALPDKAFCIVLSGGYEGHYKHAFPILNELNVHADAFVATDLVGASSYPGISQFIPHFGWSEAIEMSSSGNMSIFALWHPFDNNKSYEHEVQRKIYLIKKNVPGSKPESAFFMNMSNDFDEKQSALNEAGIGLNLVYYWSYNNNFKSKGHIPYIGVNQESNILDVIDAFNAKTRCQSKLDLGFDSIDNMKFDWKAKLDDITLPIDENPRVKNLLRNAIPLSVIGGIRKDKADLIVLNNFIEVVFRPWYHFFDYDNHMYLNWPELSVCRLDKDIIRTTNTNVADFVITGLHNGFCSDVWTDQYYIPAKPGYMIQHLCHNVMIYGYLKGTNVFKAISYTKTGHYEVFELTPEALLRSCASEYFNSVQLIKNNPDCQVTYDLDYLKQKLVRYISSGYEWANNTKCTNYDPHQYVNNSACLKFPEYLLQTVKKENRVYPVCLYGYAEHKKCMGWRLKYIADREGIKNKYFAEYNEYSANVAQRIVNLDIKYNFKKSDRTIDAIVELAKEINIKELEAISKLLNMI